MSSLQTAREALKSALSAGEPEVALKVHAHVPEDLEPPCIALQPADPYLTAEDTFDEDEWDLNVEIYCLVELKSNEQAFDDLDSLLADVITLLPTGWFIENVTRPQPFHTADWLAHGIRLNVSTRIHI